MAHNAPQQSPQQTLPRDGTVRVQGGHSVSSRQSCEEQPRTRTCLAGLPSAVPGAGAGTPRPLHRGTPHTEDAHKANLKQNTCMLDASICSSCKGDVQEPGSSSATDGMEPRNISDRMAPPHIAPGGDKTSWLESEPIIFWQM